MLVLIKFPLIVNQILMAIHTFLLIPGTRIDYGLVCQHGTPLVRNIENIPMAFSALFIFEIGIGFLAVFFVIILPTNKMKDQVFEAVKGLGEKEFIGILRSR